MNGVQVNPQTWVPFVSKSLPLLSKKKKTTKDMLLRNADIPVSQNLFVHFGYLIQIEAVYDCALCEISQDT